MPGILLNVHNSHEAVQGRYYGYPQLRLSNLSTSAYHRDGARTLIRHCGSRAHTLSRFFIKCFVSQRWFQVRALHLMPPLHQRPAFPELLTPMSPVAHGHCCWRFQVTFVLSVPWPYSLTPDVSTLSTGLEFRSDFLSLLPEGRGCVSSGPALAFEHSRIELFFLFVTIFWSSWIF